MCTCIIIVCNILKCIGKHSFSYECKQIFMLSKHSYVFFLTFYLNFLTFKKKLIINNEYKSMVFTILWGCLPYSNDWNILECECTYGSYYACMYCVYMCSCIIWYVCIDVSVCEFQAWCEASIDDIKLHQQLLCCWGQLPLLLIHFLVIAKWGASIGPHLP